MMKRILLGTVCVVFLVLAAIPLAAAASGVRPFEVGAPQQSAPEPLEVFDCSAIEDIPQDQCDALVALYISTNGDGWTDSTNWLSTTTACSWYGVECELGEVTALWLSFNQLSGTIPADISWLWGLHDLELNSNNLSGAIPPELGSMTSLRTVNLAGNNLSGSIPADLGYMVGLSDLRLNGNQLTGSIPPELGDLGGLEYLDLSYNQLTGTIPSALGDLDLEHLILASNQLTGTIPSSLGNLAYLQVLWLNQNQLSGSIPPELGNLSNLWLLSLSGNQLGGNVPPQLGNLSGLRELYLDHNSSLSGALPLTMTNLSLTTFWFNVTNLCEPADPAFQAWLSGIGSLYRTGAICPILLPLASGWNLISQPLEPGTTAITSVLSSITGSYDLVYAYRAEDAGDPWKKYSVDAPGFLNDLTVISQAMGIWLNATSDVTLTVAGTLPASPSMALAVGWNLVGYPSQVTRPVTIALSSCTGSYDLVYGYYAEDTGDPWKKYSTTAPEFLNDLKEMSPGRGYWINATAACTWTLP